MASTYFELLQDPQWQRKRLEILTRDDWTCRKCGSKEETLHVHHCYYQKAKKPWEYPEWSLLTLCKNCHKIIGAETHYVNLMLTLHAGRLPFIAGVLSGIACRFGELSVNKDVIDKGLEFEGFCYGAHVDTSRFYAWFDPAKSDCITYELLALFGRELKRPDEIEEVSSDHVVYQG